MQVRKKFRRVKRFVYLGAITGTVVAVRRQRARKAAAPAFGAPASWPPLESSKDAPVAASGSWADRTSTASTTSSAAPDGGAADATPSAAEPVAAVGALVADAPNAGADEAAVDEDGVAAAESGADESGSDESGSSGSAADDQAWVAPTYGACPTSHPVKANANSGIFHVPGGRFYDRTQAERCYVDATAAEADGFRAAKEH